MLNMIFPDYHHRLDFELKKNNALCLLKKYLKHLFLCVCVFFFIFIYLFCFKSLFKKFSKNIHMNCLKIFVQMIIINQKSISFLCLWDIVLSTYLQRCLIETSNFCWNRIFNIFNFWIIIWWKCNNHNLH